MANAYLKWGNNLFRRGHEQSARSKYEKIIGADLAVPVTSESILETTINEYIDLRFVDSCKTLDEWIHAVGTALRDDPYTEVDIDNELENKIKNYIEDKKQLGELIWSESLGTAVLL